MSINQDNAVRHFIEVEILGEDQQPTRDPSTRLFWRVKLRSGDTITISDADYQTITSRPK